MMCFSLRTSTGLERSRLEWEPTFSFLKGATTYALKRELEYAEAGRLHNVLIKVEGNHFP